MTKHWPEQSLLALPSLSHLGEQRDHQLDFHRDALQSGSLFGLARCAPAKHWTQYPSQMVPQQPARLEKPAPPERAGEAPLMDKAVPPGSSHTDSPCDKEPVAIDSWNSQSEMSGNGGGKKKNYKRYPKPPYSYLAMIAMVIQRSPEKKLTLSEVRISPCYRYFCVRSVLQPEQSGTGTRVIYARCFF